MNFKFKVSGICNQSGAVAVVTAILMTVFLSFVALAVDVGHLVVTKNELQNAADAGALAGARELYNSDGTEIQEEANIIARDTAIQNLSEKVAVEVDPGPGVDVLRGHWSFAEREFIHNPSTTVVALVGKTTAELDADPDFINAVQVTAHRSGTPIASYFAKIFGFNSFKQQATAVAWVGFAGKFVKGEFDLPIAICEELLGYPYICGIAVMYEQVETAMWTNMEQPDLEEDACNSADANEITTIIEEGNPTTLTLGLDMGVNNGVIDVAVSKLITKWEEYNEDKNKVWPVILPVVSCVDNEDDTEENTCAELTGAVEIEIIWITDKENKDAYEQVPYDYYDQDGTQIFDYAIEDDGTDQYDINRWNAFASDPDIGLVDSDGNPLPLKKDNFYFRASCEPAETIGGVGGTNFGVLAQRPVLVN
ncbi:MAG: TadG family pilus assembly protein [Desulfobacula sp.]|jgi:hypothetical protein|nr:TadG family pilus assembly protein [Desulfobacula sp.]